MPKNVERILNEPSNREEEEKLGERRDFYLGDSWYGANLKKVSEKLKNLKDVNTEQALALNEEFDRLAENMQKKAEQLQKAQEEFEEFSKRLNAKVEEKEK